MEDFRRSSEYKDSALVMLDSVHSFSQKSYHNNSSLRFAMMKKVEEERLGKIRSVTWIGISLLLIIVFILVVSYVLRGRKLKCLSVELELSKKEAELHKAQLEKDSLKVELDDYMAKYNNDKLSMTVKDNLVKEMIEELSASSDKVPNKTLVAKLKAINNESDNLDKFLSYIGRNNPELFSTLSRRFPDLTQNDFRYISLVYLQLTINEIASLLNITPAASKKRKQRICAKMGLDSTTDLYAYLLDI